LTGTTEMVSRRRGLGRNCKCALALIKLNSGMIEFGHSPSYNWAFRTRTCTPNAQLQGAAINLAACDLYSTFWPLHARGAAWACSPLPSSFFLFLFFSTRLHLEPLFPWLSRRKSFRQRRTRAPGRRARRVHAARPMRCRFRSAPVSSSSSLEEASTLFGCVLRSSFFAVSCSRKATQASASRFQFEYSLHI
jgi:hypothetical protein